MLKAIQCIIGWPKFLRVHPSKSVIVPSTEVPKFALGISEGLEGQGVERDLFSRKLTLSAHEKPAASGPFFVSIVAGQRQDKATQSKCFLYNFTNLKTAW